MSLTLSQTQAISILAEQLYSFLPGQANPYADQAISFSGVAADLGLAQYWSGGSKLPGIQLLLTNTLDKKPREFSRLMVEIVRRGLGYRSKRGTPLTRNDMQEINKTIESLGMKIPELIDPAFVETLPRAEAKPTESVLDSATVNNLLEEFQTLTSLAPQPRGYAFEKFLNRMFKSYGLEPREAFALKGEQIDGSLHVDNDTYLAEARYRNEQADNAALSVLSMKIAGKAQWSRGMFISYGGFSPTSLEAFARGKATNLICLDGLDIHHTLSGRLDLAEVIRRKARRAAETNQAFVSVREIFGSVL